MAYRRHIIAARNTTQAALEQTLAAIKTAEIQSAGGWCWTMASVWHAGAGDILDALAPLEGPALLTTTEDGCRWWLHLLGNGRDRFSTFHEFTLLNPKSRTHYANDDWEDVYGDALEETEVIEIGTPPLPEQRLTPLTFEDDFFTPYADADENEDDWSDDEDDDETDSPIAGLLESYEDSGVPLPDELVDALETCSDEDVFQQFITLHARHIADALKVYGVPHDREAILGILTGEGVTRAELESDPGNLWRFLEHLGLGTAFADARRELEAGAEDDEEDESVDPAAEILAIVEGLPAHALAGGPAPVPLEEVPRFFRIATCLEDLADAVIRVRTGDRADNWPNEKPPAYVLLSPQPDGTTLTFDGQNTLNAPRARARVGNLLTTLPEGAGLTIGSGGRHGRFRLGGTVRGGRWYVEIASVPLDAGEIDQMLAIFRAAETGEAQTACDDSDADAILECAARDTTLYDALPDRDGCRIRAHSRDGSEALAGIVFRRRFGHRWDTAAAQQRMDENFENWMRVTREIEQESAPPATSEVIYDGTASRFLAPDYDAASVDDALREKATNTGAADDEFAALGYQYLGTMVCERVSIGFLRCYANADERTYGVRYLLPYVPVLTDFTTRMDDDSVLTTTTSPLESSIRSLRILIRLCTKKRLADLHADHREGIRRLEERGLRPAAIDASLPGIARAMDDYLARRLGAESDDR